MHDLLSEDVLWHDFKAYLEAIHCQPPAGLLIAILQVTDNAMVNILFLLSKKMGRDSIEGVAAQLVITLNGL